MIILNSEALLVFEEESEDDIVYTHGYIVYHDGYRLDVGRFVKGEGNFLYDKKYVYRWRLDKGYPSLYDIKKREAVLDPQVGKDMIENYRRLLK